jgi:hypothetical protein
MVKRLFVLMATLALSATGARAAVLVDAVGTPTESGGIWTYVFEATLQASAVLEPEDFFTVYDFKGLGAVDNSSFVVDPALAGDPTKTFSFGVTSELLGENPPNLKLPAPDSAVVPNVTVSLLAGSDNIVPSGTNVLLGTLTLTSTFGPGGRQFVASEFLDEQGLPAGNRHTVAGAIPEPSTYAFMSIGLLAVGALARRARNRR